MEGLRELKGKGNEIGEEDQKVHIPSYKLNKSWRCNNMLGDYS